jgi:hypothetical protein
LTGSVRFGFISLKSKKPNRTQTKKIRKQIEPNWKKPSQNWKNRAKLVWTDFYPKNKNRFEPKPVCLNRFRFKKKSIWLFFLIKTKLNWKWSPLAITIEGHESIQIRFKKYSYSWFCYFLSLFYDFYSLFKSIYF